MTQPALCGARTTGSFSTTSEGVFMSIKNFAYSIRATTLFPDDLLFFLQPTYDFQYPLRRVKISQHRNQHTLQLFDYIPLGNFFAATCAKIVKHKLFKLDIVSHASEN